MTVDSYIPRGLDFLRRLNGLRNHHGERLSSCIRTEDFEPWWFSQEGLFWHLIVPYFKHHARLQPAMAGLSEFSAELAPEAQAVLSRLAQERSENLAYSGLAPEEEAQAMRLALTSTAAALRFRLAGKDTLLYAIDILSPGKDHDFRIGAIYRELRSRGYMFVEYLHYSDPKQARANRELRNRSAVYFESFTTLAANWRRSGGCAQAVMTAGSFDFSVFGHDALFARAVARWALRKAYESVLEVRILRYLLRLGGIKRAVVLDDSRHANELIAACKSLGIPVLGYMHGLLNRYHVGLMAYGFEGARRHTFDLYGFWSEYFRQRVVQGGFYTEADTFTCGPLRLPSQAETDGLRTSPRKTAPPLRILIASEPRAPQEEVAAYILALLADTRFRVFVKSRPGEERPYACRGLSTEAQSQIALIPGGTVFEAFQQADVVVASYSSVLYEAALALRPILYIGTSFSYGDDIAQDQLVEVAETPDEAGAAVIRAAATPEDILIRRRDTIWGRNIKDGACALFDEAETRLWKCPKRRRP
jgi:hypothetical protein